MLMVGFRGTTLSADNPIVADVRDRGIGGVVFFAYDVVLDAPGAQRGIAGAGGGPQRGVTSIGADSIVDCGRRGRWPGRTAQ